MSAAGGFEQLAESGAEGAIVDGATDLQLARAVDAARIRIAETPVSVRCSAPALGQDTETILAALRTGKGWPAHASTQ